MTSALTAQDVKKVARLARLDLSPQEIEAFTPQLAKVLGYVEQLAEVETEDVEPMAHAADIHNVFREDEPAPSLPREAALQNAPRTDGKYFVVPQILEGG